MVMMVDILEAQNYYGRENTMINDETKKKLRYDGNASFLDILKHQ